MKKLLIVEGNLIEENNTSQGYYDIYPNKISLLIVKLILPVNL